MLIVVALCTYAASVSADESNTDKQTVYIVEVNGWKLPEKSFELLYSVVSKGKGAMKAPQLLESVIEARLIAHHGEEKLGREALYKTTPVGYPVAALLEDEYLGILRMSFQKQFQTYLEQNHEGDMNNLVSLNLNFESKIPDQEKHLSLDHQLSDQHKSQYQEINVATIDLPSGSSSKISLLEVFNAQNIQGKMAIKEGNLGFVKNQATILLSKKYFAEWSLVNGFVTPEELDAIKQIVWDKHVKNRVLLSYGLNKDIHDDNPVLNQAYKDVTADEVNAYYANNKERFRKILFVEARHIRVATEKDARAVQKSLLRGMPFEEAVKTYSIADDKNLQIPGSLGRIRDTDKKDWLHTVVFALGENTVSKPFRSPQHAGQKVFWEIFFVDKKQMGYHAVDSETVRYLAGKEIATMKLKENFKSLRQSLFDQANIKMNNPS